MEPAVPARERCNSPDFDWNAMLEEARFEGVAPLLHSLLRAQDWVPTAIQAALHDSYLTTGLVGSLLLDDLRHAADAFLTAGIPVLVLKGMALLDLYGGDVALRPMVDVDILIRVEDIERSLQLLQDLGYSTEEREVRADTAFEFESETIVRRSGPIDTVIDLHWSLLDSPYYQNVISVNWLWENAADYDLDGVSCRRLSSEAMLLHLCSHLVYHHHAQGLIRYVDITKLLEGEAERIDWDLLFAKALQWDLTLTLQSSLLPLHRDWGVQLPVAVVEYLEAFTPSRRESGLFSRLTEMSPGAGRRFWIDLRYMSARQRLRFAVRHTFPSAHYMRQRYGIRNDLLLPLVYPYRWLRGIVTLGKRRN